MPNTTTLFCHPDFDWTLSHSQHTFKSSLTSVKTFLLFHSQVFIPSSGWMSFLSRIMHLFSKGSSKEQSSKVTEGWGQWGEDGRREGERDLWNQRNMGNASDVKHTEGTCQVLTSNYSASHTTALRAVSHIFVNRPEWGIWPSPLTRTQIWTPIQSLWYTPLECSLSLKLPLYNM